MLLLARTKYTPTSFEGTRLAPKVLEDRIAGRRALRLIRTWLRAGVTEEGQWSRAGKGIPKGRRLHCGPQKPFMGILGES